MGDTSRLDFGLKLWSINDSLIKDAVAMVESDLFGYIELSPVPGTFIDAFARYDVLYIVHVTPERFGFNIADPAAQDHTRRLLDNCILWADRLGAEEIILHPGSGPFAVALRFLEAVDDPRILIENMTKVGLADETMVGHLPDQIRALMDGRFGFCFDANHAIKAAISLGIPYQDIFDGFLSLRPRMAHLSDGTFRNEKDEHLGIGEGEYDFRYILERLVHADVDRVTLETARRDPSSLDEDRANVERLRDVLPL